MKNNHNYAERMRNLYFAIGYYRRRRGVTQEELAEELGISRQHLAAIESPNMDRGLSLELLFNIAEALQVEPYQLLKFGTEDSFPAKSSAGSEKG